MKRSEFLKRLGLGIAAIPFAKQVAGAVTEVMNDEAGIIADGVPKEWLAKPPIHDEMIAKYGHYEEPWIHEGWPLRLNDIIAIENSDDEYLVTALHRDPVEGKQMATCIPFKEGPPVYITRDNNIIRFSNLKSQL